MTPLLPMSLATGEYPAEFEEGFYWVRYYTIDNIKKYYISVAEYYKRQWFLVGTDLAINNSPKQRFWRVEPLQKIERPKEIC